jgi:hypothetical protein
VIDKGGREPEQLSLMLMFHEACGVWAPWQRYPIERFEFEFSSIERYCSYA